MNLETLLESALLPSLPQVAVRLLEIAKNPDAEIQEVVSAIKMDPAITIKILKAANSSYFTFRSKVTTIERAVPMLGTNVVSSLVLSFSLVDSITSTGPVARHYQDYWKQSIAQAASAETIGTISGEGLTVLAERLRRAIESLKFENQGTRVPVTISVGAGIADCKCEDADQLKTDLIGLADLLLYMSKEGRNQLHADVLKPPMHSAIPAYVAHPTPTAQPQS